MISKTAVLIVGGRSKKPYTMNIVIKQSIFTLLRKKYTITIDYHKKYIIRRKLFSFPALFEIKNAQTTEVIGSLSNKNFLKRTPRSLLDQINTTSNS